MKKRRRFAPEFKAKVALEALAGELTTSELAAVNGYEKAPHNHAAVHPLSGHFACLPIEIQTSHYVVLAGGRKVKRRRFDGAPLSG